MFTPYTFEPFGRVTSIEQDADGIRVTAEVGADGMFAMLHPTLNPAMRIKRVIQNDPATIVIWSDGEKTVSKAVNEPFDPEKGLAICVMKRVYGKCKTGKLMRKWGKVEN